MSCTRRRTRPARRRTIRRCLSARPRRVPWPWVVRWSCREKKSRWTDRRRREVFWHAAPREVTATALRSSGLIWRSKEDVHGVVTYAKSRRHLRCDFPRNHQKFQGDFDRGATYGLRQHRTRRRCCSPACTAWATRNTRTLFPMAASMVRRPAMPAESAAFGWRSKLQTCDGHERSAKRTRTGTAKVMGSSSAILVACGHRVLLLPIRPISASRVSLAR